MTVLRFTNEHEWISFDNGVATVGITDFASHQLGDIVFVELPEIGKSLEKGGQAAVVESVKAASEVYSPASGKVVEVNQAIADQPGTVNESPEGSGWFYKMELSAPGELSGLMDKDAYDAYLKTLDH